MSWHVVAYLQAREVEGLALFQLKAVKAAVWACCQYELEQYDPFKSTSRETPQSHARNPV